MRIGIISDTHGWLDTAIWRLFGEQYKVNRIVHAGDWGGWKFVRELETIAPVLTIQGNGDAAHPRVREVLTEQIDGTRIQVRHRLDQSGNSVDRYGSSIRPDIVVYGHTHRPDVFRRTDTLYINPGSATRSRSGENTVGILELNRNEIAVSIHELAAGNRSMRIRWPADV